EILSIHAMIGKKLSTIPKEFPKAIVVDPVDPTVFALEKVFPMHDDKLLVNDFANLCEITHQWRNWFHEFLERGGLVVVYLRPYCVVEHYTQMDLQIGNYDWLWEGAGMDSRLKITPQNNGELEVLEYGLDSPFSTYFQKSQLYIHAIAKGNFYIMAVNQIHKAASFMLPYKNGKVVFLPPGKGEERVKALTESIFEGLKSECWPSVELIKEIKPSWISSYVLPESSYLEDVLTKKENEIQALEEECELVHERLGYLSQIRNSLFCGTFNGMSSALASIFSQWGVDVYPLNNSLELISGEKHGICLPVVTPEIAKLWSGKKLARLLPQNSKGFLIVNSHRYEKPSYRPKRFCSPSLIEFAIQHNFCIISLFDIFMAHCRGDKTFFAKAWDAIGVLELGRIAF
ncbi:MAG TPA: hypothetical protein PLR86_11630, partial [Planctomycetota bacterium]|nr:hypothetical protein [Planctomycetota bacterium]